MLAREYGWLPNQSDEVYWADVQRYLEMIQERQILKQKEQIWEYVMLTNLVHTADPGKFINALKDSISGQEEVSEIGDIKRLKGLKAKSGGRLSGNR